MRMVFGILGLVITLAVVGMLAKKQLGAVNAIQVPSVSGASGSAADGNTATSNAATVQQQAVQIQQQYKAAAEAAMQQTRPMPDDK